LRIRVENPSRLMKGVRRLRIDGRVVEGNIADAALLSDRSEIIATLEA